MTLIVLRPHCAGEEFIKPLPDSQTTELSNCRLPDGPTRSIVSYSQSAQVML